MRLIDADKLIEKLSTGLDNPEEFPVINIGTLMRMINDEPEVPHAQPEEDWIPVGKDMLVEYDSVFTRFHGTDKWRDGMWLKSSAKVLVTVEFEDGTRLTETARTIDGNWKTDNHIIKRKVIAWQKMPKEYKGK